MKKQSLITILLTVLMSMVGAKAFAYDIEVEKIHEDEIYTLQVIMASKRCMTVSDQLYFRRIRDNSIMTSEASIE